MARPSVFTDKQWAEIEEIAKAANDLKNDEIAVIIQLKLLLLGGDLARLFRVDKIIRYRFEIGVGTGRIDLLLFHSDGGVSIIEAKGDNSMRDLCAGIGQLFLYEIGLEKKLSHNKPKYINRILCAPISAEKSLPLVRACKNAGVKFVHLAPYSVLKEQIDSCRG